MTPDEASKRIQVAIAGVGNCAASFIEGLCFYRQHPHLDTGLLFPVLCGYSARDIDVVAAFDIALKKVGFPVRQTMYQPPNNFVRLNDLRVDGQAYVFRGPTLDEKLEKLLQRRMVSLGCCPCGRSTQRSFRAKILSFRSHLKLLQPSPIFATMSL